MDALAALITFVVGLGGVTLGAVLARRNDRRAQGERLLVEALNDAVGAIAAVAGGAGREAQRQYASAVSRIALHGSPAVVAAFRRFQADATTLTEEGRQRLLEVILAARAEAGYRPAPAGDLEVLLFGAGPVLVQSWEEAEAGVRETVIALQRSTPEQEGPERWVTADAELTRLAALAEGPDPVDAVVAGFDLLVQELRAIAADARIEGAPSLEPLRLTREASAAGVISTKLADAISGLGVLRNLAVHGGSEDTTRARAREYVAQAHAVLYALRTVNRPSSPR